MNSNEMIFLAKSLQKVFHSFHANTAFVVVVHELNIGHMTSVVMPINLLLKTNAFEWKKFIEREINKQTENTMKSLAKIFHYLSKWDTIHIFIVEL